MSNWKFVGQRILFGEEKEVLGKNGVSRKVTMYTDPQTGEMINTWGVQVIEKTYITPSGGEHKQVMTSGKGLHSVMIFALSKDFEVILVKQFRQSIDAEMIECPAGLMLNEHENITHEELGIREVLEETGYGKPDKITQLSDPLYVSTGKADTYFVPFLATGLEKIADQSLDPSEDIEVITMSLPDWLRMIKSRQIVGASSITTTMLALMELKGDETIKLFEQKSE